MRDQKRCCAVLVSISSFLSVRSIVCAWVGTYAFDTNPSGRFDQSVSSRLRSPSKNSTTLLDPQRKTWFPCTRCWFLRTSSTVIGRISSKATRFLLFSLCCKSNPRVLCIPCPIPAGCSGLLLRLRWICERYNDAWIELPLLSDEGHQKQRDRHPYPKSLLRCSDGLCPCVCMISWLQYANHQYRFREQLKGAKADVYLNSWGDESVQIQV